MKRLATITDKDITGADGVLSAEPHIAVNAVLLDQNNKIAICHLAKHNVCTIVGGGVEYGEDLITAVKREVLEETGCNCEIICEIGSTFESRVELNETIERNYYLARVVGEKGELSLTEAEISQGVTVGWHTIKEALQLVKSNTSLTYQQKYIQYRDVIVLNEVLENHADKIGAHQ